MLNCHGFYNLFLSLSTLGPLSVFDIVEGLPKSDGMHVILVVIDKVTKYAHFWPYNALQVAKLYFSQVYHLHGLTSTIIS
jgi:hypothetical protein